METVSSMRPRKTILVEGGQPFFRGGFQTQALEKGFEVLEGFKSVVVRGLYATKVIDVIYTLVMINGIGNVRIRVGSTLASEGG